jgi:hypothetical protein
MYMLGALALHISLFRKAAEAELKNEEIKRRKNAERQYPEVVSEQPTNVDSKDKEIRIQIVPKIRIVGLDYCKRCRFFLEMGLEKAVKHENLFGNHPRQPGVFNSLEELNPSEDGYQFGKEFGPNMLIICCDAQEPVYKVAADLYRQCGMPGAFLDGLHIPGPLSEPNERNPADSSFDQMRQLWKHESVLYDPTKHIEEEYEYERETFPDTRWTLYTSAADTY